MEKSGEWPNSVLDYLDYDVYVRLAFKPNPRPDSPKRTNWVAYYEGKTVLSSDDLDEFIVRRRLVETIKSGQMIWVGLRAGGGSFLVRRRFYHAYPVPGNLAGEAAPIIPSLFLDSDLAAWRVAVFIDGQNFLFGWQKLGFAISPAALIKRICQCHEVKLLEFYICWQGAYDEKLIDGARRQEIEQIPGIEIVERQMKTISNGQIAPVRTKIDMDTWLATKATAVYHQMPGLQGAVFVTGDCDFAPTLDVWADRSGLGGGPKYLEVVCANYSLSRELRGYAGAQVIPLERFLGKE